MCYHINMIFAPLHVYSGYSFLSSALRMEEYLLTSKKFGYTHVGLSDLATLQGAPNFFEDAMCTYYAPPTHFMDFGAIVYY